MIGSDLVPQYINIKVDPGESAKFFFGRALVSEGMGKVNRAVEEIRTALGLESTDAEMKADHWSGSCKRHMWR